MIRRKPTDGEETPSFSSVFKIVTSVLTGVATVGVAAAFGWLWSTNSDLTSMKKDLAAALEQNKEDRDRLGRLGDVAAAHGATIAVIQSQLLGAQTAAAAERAATNERVRSLEWQNRFAPGSRPAINAPR